MMRLLESVLNMPRGTILWDGDEIVGVAGVNIPIEYIGGYCYHLGHIDYEYVERELEGDIDGF